MGIPTGAYQHRDFFIDIIYLYGKHAYFIVAKRDLREMLWAEFISVTGGVLAGVVLASMTRQLTLIPGLFILIPGFLSMRGAVGGSLSSRISSGLFLGVVKPRMTDRIVASNMLAAAMLVMICSIVLGMFAHYASAFLFGADNIKIMAVSAIAGALSLVMIPINVYTTLWIFRKGHDPNNIMGPYITTLGDLFGTASFMVAVWAVL